MKLNKEDLRNVAAGGIVIGDRLHDFKDVEGILILREDNPKFSRMKSNAILANRARIVSKEGKTLHELNENALESTVAGRAILGNLPHNPNGVIVIKDKAGNEFAYAMPIILAEEIIARPELRRVAIIREARLLNQSKGFGCFKQSGNGVPGQ